MSSLLVLHLERLGDLVQATPLLRSLVSGGAWERVDLVVHDRPSRVLDGLDGFATVHRVPGERIARLNLEVAEHLQQGSEPEGAAALLRELDLPRYDLVLNLAHAHLGSWLCGRIEADERQGGVINDAGEWLYLGEWSCYLVAMLDAREANRFNIVDLLRAEARTPRPPTCGERPHAAMAADAGVVLPPGRLVALHPGANKDARRWSPAGFGRVAAALHEAGLTPVLVGAPQDREACAAVEAQCAAPLSNLCGSNDLFQMTRLLAEVELLVSNDTGAAHLAAAAGTRVVTCSRPGCFRETAPWGVGHVVVEPGGPHDDAGLERLDARCVALVALDRLDLADRDELQWTLRATGTRAWETRFLDPGLDPLGGLTFRPLHATGSDDLLALALRHAFAAALCGGDASARAFAELAREQLSEPALHPSARDRLERSIGELADLARLAERLVRDAEKPGRAERLVSLSTEVMERWRALHATGRAHGAAHLVLAFVDWRLRLMPPADPRATFQAHADELARGARLLETTLRLVDAAVPDRAGVPAR